MIPIDFDLYSFLETSTTTLSVYQVVRGVFIVLDVILLSIFVYATNKLYHYRPHFEIRARSSKKAITLQDAVFREQWQKVTDQFYSSPEGQKLAIIEADKLADDVLKRLGFEGEHMADRLENLSPDDLRTLERLWRAHRVRKDIGTAGFDLPIALAKRTMEDYEAFFKEIKLL